MDTIATAVASILNLMPNAAKMEGNAQPNKAKIKIPTNVFSALDIGPSSAKPSAAIFLLSTVVIVGLLNKYVMYGTTNNIAMPGTIIARAHKPQSK